MALSLTTLRPELQRVMEPRTSSPARRLEAMRALTDAGVPVRAMIAPVIPGLTDEEVPALVEAAAAAGAVAASMLVVRLPHGVKGLFADWLEAHFPDRKGRVLHRIREVRGGALNDPRFGSRMKGEGPYAEQLHQLFRAALRRCGLEDGRIELDATAFRRPRTDGQLGLFDAADPGSR